MFITTASDDNEVDIAAKVAAIDINDDAQTPNEAPDDGWGRIRLDPFDAPPDEANDANTWVDVGSQMAARGANATAAEDANAWAARNNIDVDNQMADDDVNKWINEMAALADANTAASHAPIYTGVQFTRFSDAQFSQEYTSRILREPVLQS